LDKTDWFAQSTKNGKIEAVVSSALSVRHYTIDEYLALPPRPKGQRDELIEGKLVLSPEPELSHARVNALILRALLPLEEQGFVLLGPTGFKLPPDSLPGPDLAVVAAERFAANSSDYLSGAPELAIEVRSPSNRQLGCKALLYLQHGAEAVWIVNPRRRTVTVYSPGDETDERRESETLEFHGVQIAVVTLFPPRL
jgi:Uma2 family endonuclease